MADWVRGSSLPEFRHIKPYHALAALEELLQLCRHVMADGHVEEHEAHLLREWVRTHREATGHWPGNVLSRRLMEVYRDGRVSETERGELRDLLHQVLDKPDPTSAATQTQQVPFDVPAPDIVLPGKNLCFAGRFVFGTIERCIAVLHQNGARCHGHPQWDTNFLVVGALRPDDSMVERAVKLKKLGSGCKIVSEEHWTAFVPGIM